MLKVGRDTFLVTVSTTAFAVICSSLALIFEFGIFAGIKWNDLLGVGKAEMISGQIQCQY
jgi:hypothetical protein